MYGSGFVTRLDGVGGVMVPPMWCSNAVSRACLGQDGSVGGEDDGILTAGGRGIGRWWCWSVWLGGEGSSVRKCL